MRLDNGRPEVSAQKAKTVFESIATTPQGVKALANFLLSELRPLSALKDGHMYATHAYTALASKVATDDEIVAVIIIILPLAINVTFGRRRFLKRNFVFHSFIVK